MPEHLVVDAVNLPVMERRVDQAFVQWIRRSIGMRMVVYVMGALPFSPQFLEE